MNNSILILAAHPDDEVLGCGGTIAKLTENGINAHVAFLADGVSSRDRVNEEFLEEIKLRRKAAQNACDILGVKSVSFGELPDNQMDTIPLLDIVKNIESLITKYSPREIYTHHIGDVNIDHCITHRAAVTACRPQPGNSVDTFLSFEIPSSTEWQLPSSSQIFAPNWYVDISKTLDCKLAAIEAYRDEMREWPHPRSLQAVKHLAHWRGSTIGVDAAEAFMLGRNLV